MPASRGSNVFNHSPYSELSGPVIKPGTVSTRKEALLNAYKRAQEPQRTPIKPPLPSKSHIPAKLPSKSCVHPASRNEELEGPEGLAFGPVRRKTGGFATHTCRSSSCIGSSLQTRDPSKAVLYTIASLGLMGKGDVAGITDDEHCTGSQSLLHTNTSGTLLPPLKKQCLLVARIVDQLTEKTPELKRVLTRGLAGDQELLDVPSQDMGEDLSDLIDKALGARNDSGTDWSGENPRHNFENVLHDGQGETGFLGEETRITNSPTVLSPEIRRTDPFKIDDISQLTNHHRTRRENTSSFSTECSDRHTSVAETLLPCHGSDTLPYVMDRSGIACLETLKAHQGTSEHRRRQNSTCSRSQHAFDLAKTRTISAPCASAEHIAPPDQGHCDSNLHRTQEKAASVEQNLRNYTQGERNLGPDSLPEIVHANTKRLNGSTSSERQWIGSEQRGKTPRSWRWWRFVLIDKELGNRQSLRTDTRSADKQTVEDGMHVYADSGRDDEYETEKEHEQEILRVLIHREQPTADYSPANMVGRPEPGTPTADLCSEEVTDGGVKDLSSKEVGKANYRFSVTIEGRSDTKTKVDICSRETA